MSTNQRSDSTIRYYEERTAEFISATVNVEMEHLYDHFLPLIPTGGSILDTGCGSGRDAHAFSERGYRVTAIDASANMVDSARRLTGLPVQLMGFDEIEWTEEFDGIWACASLLHVPLAQLPAMLVRLAEALKPNGVMYLSFKYGRGERTQRGRHFTDMDEKGLDELLALVPELQLVEVWQTDDVRRERTQQRWLNAVARRKA